MQKYHPNRDDPNIIMIRVAFVILQQWASLIQVVLVW